jgi:predicted flap endonuclease-1-like 5' DNA nuclease
MSLKKSYVKSKKAYKVTFEIPANTNPENKEVRLLGSFNNWSWEKAPVLKKDGNKFSTQQVLPEGKQYQYRYFVGQDYWVNDGKADSYCASGVGDVENCVLDLKVNKVKITNIKPAKKKATSKKKASPKAKATKAKVTAKKSTKKASVAKVDFTKIEGIGPKIAGILQKSGYKTYGDLGKAKKKDLLAILEKAGNRYKMHDPSNWAKQSKALNK